MTGRPVITEATVRQAADAGRTLDVPANAIVTPAAKDLAEQLGIELRNTERQTDRTTGKTATPAPVPSFRIPGAPSLAVVALGADHGGYPMKEALKPLLAELGFEILDVGTGSTEAVDYPDYAAAVAVLVATGKASRGIMVDGAGIGSAMAANKIPGVRAALCYDLTTAKNAREHNDANVLTLGGTLIGQRLAGDIVKAFLTTDFGGGRHQARVDKINALD